MQGSPKVLAQLNKLLAGELSAADQYFVHSRMYENWGFRRLFARLEHERQEELQHASLLIQRILFLGGNPDLAIRSHIKVGKSVPEMIQNDLNYELSVIGELRGAIAVCESERDYETRRILLGLLTETEEDHTKWLEVQQRLIASIGLENYLQSAAGEITREGGEAK